MTAVISFILKEQRIIWKNSAPTKSTSRKKVGSWLTKVMYLIEKKCLKNNLPTRLCPFSCIDTSFGVSDNFVLPMCTASCCWSGPSSCSCMWLCKTTCCRYHVDILWIIGGDDCGLPQSELVVEKETGLNPTSFRQKNRSRSRAPRRRCSHVCRRLLHDGRSRRWHLVVGAPKTGIACCYLPSWASENRGQARIPVKKENKRQLEVNSLGDCDIMVAAFIQNRR